METNFPSAESAGSERDTMLVSSSNDRFTYHRGGGFEGQSKQRKISHSLIIWYVSFVTPKLGWVVREIVANADIEANLRGI